jgi:hypothetical protein
MSLQTPTVIRTLQRKLYRQAKESKPPRRGRLRPELFSVCLTVKPVGEQDAGDRHVRFDERGWETERCRMAQATAPVLDSTFFCDQFLFCDAMPPEWHWVMPLGMPLLLIIIGRSRWWTILAFVPLINLIGLWVFAFTRWPDRASATAR